MSRLGHASPAQLTSRQNATVTTLQFLASLKWPLLILILAGLVTVAIKRASPETRAAFRHALLNRSLKVSVAGASFEAGAPTPQEALALATAPDAQIAASAAAGQEDATPEQVEMIRREAVDYLTRTAASMGWRAGLAGASSPPIPVWPTLIPWSAEATARLRAEEGRMNNETGDGDSGA
jgi:hypothetical protein